jgi:molybdopterin-guanine dinucleotide biosynthesis protein A
MGVDCIIAAGDGRAAKKVFKKNKALLEVGGKPIIRHIVETLKSCNEIEQIVIVGPKKKFETVIGDLGVRIIEQRRNLTENGWEAFLQTIPEYRETGILTDEISTKYKEKAVLGLPGDIPLLTVRELKEFIKKCDMDKYDYCAGVTSETILKQFEPRKGKPGIKMATFHVRDGNFRQNNMHMAKPFKLKSGIDLALKIYEYRYQKELFNIFRTIGEIIKFGPRHIVRSLWLYFLLQVSTGLSSIGLKPLARLTSYPVTRAELEKLFSGILNAMVKIVETTEGGAALDVDNEKDFLILSIRYKEWLAMVMNRYTAP